MCEEKRQKEIVEEEHLKLHAHVESFLLIHALVIVVVEFVDTRQEHQHLLEAGERLARKRLGVDPHHTRLSPHCDPPSSLSLAPPNLHASLLAMASQNRVPRPPNPTKTLPNLSLSLSRLLSSLIKVSRSNYVYLS